MNLAKVIVLELEKTLPIPASSIGLRGVTVGPVTFVAKTNITLSLSRT